MLVIAKEIKMNSINIITIVFQTIASLDSTSSLLFDDLSATCFNSYIGCSASDVITPPPLPWFSSIYCLQ